MGNSPNTGRRVTFADDPAPHHSSNSRHMTSNSFRAHHEDTFDSYDANPTSRENTSVSLGQEIRNRAGGSEYTQEYYEESPGITESSQTVTEYQTSPRNDAVMRERVGPSGETIIVREEIREDQGGNGYGRYDDGAETIVREEQVIEDRGGMGGYGRTGETIEVREEEVMEGSDHGSAGWDDRDSRFQRRGRMSVVEEEDEGEGGVEYQESMQRMSTDREVNNPSSTVTSFSRREANAPKPRMSSDLWGASSRWSQHERGGRQFGQPSSAQIAGSRRISDTESLTLSDTYANPQTSSFAARKQYGNRVTQRHRKKWMQQRNQEADFDEYTQRPVPRIRARNGEWVQSTENETFVQEGPTITQNATQRYGRRERDVVYDSNDDSGVYVPSISVRNPPARLRGTKTKDIVTKGAAKYRSPRQSYDSFLTANRKGRGAKAMSEAAEHYFDDDGNEVIKEVIHLSADNQPIKTKGGIQGTTKAVVHGATRSKRSSVPSFAKTGQGIGRRLRNEQRTMGMGRVVNDLLQPQEVARFFDEEGREVIREEMHVNGDEGFANHQDQDMKHSPRKVTTKKTSTMTKSRSQSPKRTGFQANQVVDHSEEIEKYIDEDGREVIKEEIHVGHVTGQQGQRWREAARQKSKPKMRQVVSDVMEAREVEHYVDEDGNEVIRQEVHLPPEKSTKHASNNMNSKRTPISHRGKGPANKLKKTSPRRGASNPNHFVDELGREVIREEVHVSGESEPYRGVEQFVQNEVGVDGSHYGVRDQFLGS
ncbi:hypothetical protein CAPTEDRAFT_191553 [Capitella teleta]|uniref:Uncharacterized protein n=1 Tax=Capitella teleta TaxID=283909 RepID=R7U963_CAPTE|nr:hypothetical protein CAPTEDRAFT_191553 [Capitella teleta]|eukprot:ELU00232.1 hypothetical protein CAPTEDRAFT_191553 [Capitella teleta]